MVVGARDNCAAITGRPLASAVRRLAADPRHATARPVGAVSAAEPTGEVEASATSMLAVSRGDVTQSERGDRVITPYPA